MIGGNSVDYTNDSIDITPVPSRLNNNRLSMPASFGHGNRTFNNEASPFRQGPDIMITHEAENEEDEDLLNDDIDEKFRLIEEADLDDEEEKKDVSRISKVPQKLHEFRK